LHVVGAAGQGGKGEQRRLCQQSQPALQLLPAGERCVVARQRVGRGHGGRRGGDGGRRGIARRGRSGGVPGQRPLVGAQLVARVQLAQRRGVGRARCELVDLERQVEIGADGGEPPRQLERRQSVAQVFAHLAGHLGEAPDELVQAAVLLQQFRGGL